MEIDIKHALWPLLAVALVIVGSVVWWGMGLRDAPRETQVSFAPGTVDCEALRIDPKRIELHAWLAEDEGRTIARYTREGSMQLVEKLYLQGARELLVASVDADAGGEGQGEVARDYVIVPPSDPAARRSFLEAWGGPVAETENQHKRCVVIYGS